MDISKQKTNENGQNSINASIGVAVQAFLLLFFICSTNVMAANHYILDGGTGDGTAWNNALDSLPETLVRGDTYYIGDGSYGAYTYNDSESGKTLIYIKKATESDHGTDTGWNSNFGDGQANFTATQLFTTGYYYWTGNHVPTSGLATAWGFKIMGTPGSSKAIQLDGSAELNYITIENAYIDMSGDTTGENKCIKGTCGGTDNTYITVRYCKLLNFGDGISIDSGGPNIYEYNYFERTAADGSGDHGDAIVAGTCTTGTHTGTVIRYNEFRWEGQQLFFNGGANGTFTYNNFEVYGNIFSSTVIGTSNVSTCGIHQNSTRSDINNIKIYNNTFYGTYYNVHERGLGMTGEMHNNITYNVHTDNAFDDIESMTHDYNYYESGSGVSETHVQKGGDPCVDGKNYNFTLSGPTDAGNSTILKTGQVDIIGNIIGADDCVDRGTYEFIDGIIPIATPSNLRIFSAH